MREKNKGKLNYSLEELNEITKKIPNNLQIAIHARRKSSRFQMY